MNVSSAVNQFTRKPRMSIDATPRTMANVSTWRVVSAPVTSGRCAVRAMIRSMRWSINWLSAAAEDDAIQIPSVPNTSARHGGRPGAASSIPMIAVNTSIRTMRGLVAARYWPARDGARLVPANFWLATVDILVILGCPRRLRSPRGLRAGRRGKPILFLPGKSARPIDYPARLLASLCGKSGHGWAFRCGWREDGSIDHPRRRRGDHGRRHRDRARQQRNQREQQE